VPSVVFYVIGGATAGWALLVSALGITRDEFPRSPRATRITMAISIVMVLASILAAIITGALEAERPGEVDHGSAGAADIA
jgi:hypothetical protein